MQTDVLMDVGDVHELCHEYTPLQPNFQQCDKGMDIRLGIFLRGIPWAGGQGLGTGGITLWWVQTHGFGVYQPFNFCNGCVPALVSHDCSGPIAQQVQCNGEFLNENNCGCANEDQTPTSIITQA